jgi:hypothetical protein
MYPFAMKLPRLPLPLVLACLLVPLVSCSTSGSLPANTAAARFEIEVKLITAGPQACDRLHLGDAAHVVTADAAKALVEAAAATCGVVSRPRIVVAEGGVAFITTSTKTEYVQDFDADARAVMGTVEHGVHIEATPKSTADERSDVAFVIDVSALREPMRSAQVTLPASGKTVTVQLPEVDKQRVTTSFVLGSEQAAILPLSATGGDDPVRAVVLRVRRIA